MSTGDARVRIKGCDADLQLYTKDGKACARLYIKNTYHTWKNVFFNSWVGFYKSSQDRNENYCTCRYVVHFALNDRTSTEYIYQCESSLPIAPGVQIRFLLDKTYYKVLAKTTPWEEENLRPKLTSPWSSPEFFCDPLFCDANDVIPSEIPGFDAGLQLCTKDGKACARLYIKRTFTDWRKTFKYSWVGFYTSPQDKNHKYYTYQYAVKFEMMKDGTQNFDIYEFKSTLPIMPGVRIRFLMDKGYDDVLVATKPWNSD